MSYTDPSHYVKPSHKLEIGPPPVGDPYEPHGIARWACSRCWAVTIPVECRHGQERDRCQLCYGVNLVRADKARRDKTFISDMEGLFEVRPDYHGRAFYRGPAVVIERDLLQAVIRATDMMLQWDDMGRSGYVVYPRVDWKVPGTLDPTVGATIEEFREVAPEPQSVFINCAEPTSCQPCALPVGHIGLCACGHVVAGM